MSAGFEPREMALRDGRTVRIRVIEPSDEAAILKAFERVGPESRYRRFMRPVREANVDRLHRALATLSQDGLGLAATSPGPEGDDIVGTAIYLLAPGGKSCEFAMTVADDWAGAGLGRVLLGALVEAARANGLGQIEGFVLAENAPMLRLASKLGFAVGRHPDDYGLRVCRLDLAPRGPPG